MNRRLLGSAAFYPLTLIWLLGVTMAVLVSLGGLDLTPGLAILGFVALILTQTACRLELGVVHQLVNRQHDELVERIGQLKDTLQDSNVPIPDPPKGHL